MKFLITGSAGLVGSQIVKDLEQNHTVYSCYNEQIPDHGIPIQLDLTNLVNIKQVIEKIKPESIIHLAAITNVDLCESKQELTSTINTKATQILASQAAKCDAFFVYLSTDYVFDGTKGLRKENDPTNPIGFYGKSKLEGEKTIQNLDSKWCIARTSTPFGVHKTKQSFPIWVIENLRQKKEITIHTDQYTSPTYVPNLSQMLIEISTRKLTGIFHTAGASRISRYDMASLIADKLNLDKKLLKPITMKEMIWKAKRPSDSSLDVTKVQTMLNEKPQRIAESIVDFTKLIS